MKKKHRALLLSLLILLTVFIPRLIEAAETKNSVKTYDFRNVSWGITLEQVKQYEKILNFIKEPFRGSWTYKTNGQFSSMSKGKKE